MNHQIYVAKKDGTPKFLVVDNEVYTLEALSPGVEAPAAPVTATTSRAPGRKPGRKKNARHPNAGRKVRTCSKCGEPGHMAKTCGRESDDPQEDSEDPALAAANNPAEPAQMDEAEIEQRVHEMQAEGMSSIAVAVQLHVPLKIVNKFWRNRTAELQD